MILHTVVRYITAIFLIAFMGIGRFPSPETINIDTRTAAKASEAYKYCIDKKFNTDICILIDMNIHSGLNRLFVWSFANDSILLSGLCSHGCCDNDWSYDNSKESPQFSNTPESHCSSLGKYKIGKRGYSNWGINVNYKLHGLDSTNSKAYSRFIVLHSWELIENKETYPKGTPEGWGCPAVSNSNMKKIDKILQNTSKPVLMWIYK